MAAAEIWPEHLASATIDALEGANAFWSSLPFHYVFVGHALFCTLAGPEFKSKWLVHLLLTFLWGNGGGVVTAALMMQPKVATFSFFQADFITGAWIVCWWLVNWCPGGVPAKVLNVWWIKMLAKACTMLLRAQLIVSRINLAVQLYPGLVAAPLILGTISGCGGRLLADGVMTGWQSMPGLAELTSPGFVSRSAAFAAVTYYTLAYATQLLPAQAAAGLVVTGLMLHAFASDLTGLPLDFTAPITQLLHTITFVPPPPAQPQPAPVTVALNKVTPQKQQRAAPASSSPAKPPAARTPTKSPAKQSTAPSPQGAAPAAAAAGSPLPPASARKRRGAAQQAAGEEAGTKPQQQRGQSAKSQSVAAEAGVTTRRRAAAAAYA